MKGSSLVLGALLLVAPAFAMAQQKGGIEVKTVAEVETVEQNAKGEKVKVRKEAALAKVVPDDIVIFTTTYTNRGKQPATGVAITNPIAQEMAYVEGSAEGKDTRIQFSVDNGKTYGVPGKLDRQGSRKERFGRRRPRITPPSNGRVPTPLAAGSLGHGQLPGAGEIKNSETGGYGYETNRFSFTGEAERRSSLRTIPRTSAVPVRRRQQLLIP